MRIKVKKVANMARQQIQPQDILYNKFIAANIIYYNITIYIIYNIINNNIFYRLINSLS